MNVILDQLLEKQNIKKRAEMTPEEQATFDKWEKTLSEGKLTVEKISDFCQNQLDIIEGQWKNLDNSNDKNNRLILLHTVYQTLKKLIDSPVKERDSLEKYLANLLKS